MISTKYTKGFSIIETIIAIGMLSVFVMSSISFIMFMKKSENTIVEDSEIIWQVSNIFDELGDILNEYNSIVEPEIGGSDSEVILSNNQEEEVSIYVEDGDMFARYDSDDPVKISHNIVIDNLLLSNLSFDNVEVIRFEVSIYDNRINDVETFYFTKTLR